ncbi:MAG: nuclear transport factor 2 family protein [Vicinamibacterales bacterium]
MAPLTRGAKGVPVTGAGGLAPQWAPDGRTLYDWSPDWTTVKAMDVTLQPAISVQRRRSLFTFPALSISYVRPFDLTRDGSRFLIPGQVAESPFEIRRLHKAGVYKVESAEASDMRVLVFGDHAVVNGTTTVKQTLRGKDMSGSTRWTDTFVKRDGRWQAVRSHSAKVQ